MPGAAFTPTRLEDLFAGVLLTSASDGEVLAYDSGSGRWVNAAASSASPGGSSGQAQYNDGAGGFAGAAAAVYASSGALLTVTAQAATDVPVTVKLAASQSADAFRVLAADGTPVLWMPKSYLSPGPALTLQGSDTDTNRGLTIDPMGNGNGSATITSKIGIVIDNIIATVPSSSAYVFSSGGIFASRGTAGLNLTTETRDTDSAAKPAVIVAGSAYSSAMTNVDGAGVYLLGGAKTAESAGDDGTVYLGYDGATSRGNVVVCGQNAAPADAVLAAGQMALWLDSTNGSAKLKIKAKSADGTVVVGELSLS